ncbi:MAG: hypoxanthine phosphoribosyltransferase [Clostridiales Family XIII bacterium]|jgi:hypoxanthine phosphoribosyltransferase|nr:hypoxanthine phosphoribosyltransferase [Clostridiales Family XIII bacterium]
MPEEYELQGVIFTEEQIAAKAIEIAAEISRDYKGRHVVMVGVLKGAVMWMSELLKRLDQDLDVSIDFMAVASYGMDTKTSGVVKINKDLDWSVDGKHVILVEDILDSGVTLEYLVKYLGSKNPASVSSCVLLDKPSGRKVDVEADYVGFVVDDIFIVGYGLDVAQKYRNLPFITSVKTE